MNTNETAPAPENTMNQETKPAARPQKSDLRSFIAGDAFKSQVALALPKHMTPDRFARIALTALTRTPKLMDCTRESLLGCLMTCSQLGLEPDGRLAHLIPYKDQCTLIVDYKGYAELAQRSGLIETLHADLVCENDVFDYNLGKVTVHRPDFRRPRGKPFAAYAMATTKTGATFYSVLTADEIYSIRDRSQGWIAFQKGWTKSSPWDPSNPVSEGEMMKKTAFRRLVKWLPLSPELRAALDTEDREERPAKGREVQSVPMLTLEPEPHRIEPELPRHVPVWNRLIDMMDADDIEEPALMAVLNANYLTAADRIQGMTEAECEVTIGKWATVVKEVKK
jgi:recombination protein RecT